MVTKRKVEGETIKKPKVTPLVPDDPEPQEKIIFTPKANISVIELAQVVAGLNITLNDRDAIPEHLLRHFSLVSE